MKDMGTTNTAGSSAATAGDQRTVDAAREALEKARLLIADPCAWGKGLRNCGRSFETFCAAEAIEAVTDISINYYTRIAAYNALRRAGGCEHSIGITLWNDAPQRTHAEVLAAFDKAISALKSPVGNPER